MDADLDAPADPPAMGPRRRLLTLGSLALMSAFGPLSIDLYLAALPTIGDDLSAPDSTTALTLSACMVGIAVGQLVIGPLSDRYGRRVPLLVGIGSYVLVSAMCAVAPVAGALIVLRFAQGFAAAGGIVIGRAIVRDLFHGREIARAFSLLMMISSLAPIVAPLLGGQLLLLMPWRGLFVVLAGIGLVLLLVAFLVLPESLPPERRHGGGALALRASFATVLRDRVFLGTALVQGLTFAALFAYISLSSFVLQEEYGLSPTAFSLVFSLNAAGLIVGNRINAIILRYRDTMQVLTLGLTVMAVAVAALGVAIALDWPLPPVSAALFVAVLSLGLVFPNSTAIALLPHPERAGTASALLGMIQFVLGSVIGPLASVAGASAVAMVTAMGACVVVTQVLHWAVVRPAYHSPREEIL